MSCCGTDYYWGRCRLSHVEIARLTPISESIDVPPVPGFTTAAPLQTSAPIEAQLMNAGIDAAIINAGIQFQYLPAWTSTAAIGQFAIGMSAIFTIKPYHEMLWLINGVIYEYGWGQTHPYFILGSSLLDGPDVLA